MNKIQQDILYLAACAMHQVKPETDGMDIEEIKKVAMYHTVSSMIAMALESAGIHDKVLEDQKNKAIRKVMLLDSERERIFSILDKEGIWYLPLKGVLLKEMYPVYGMRQMADNDILFDSNYRERVKEIFVSLGYKTESFFDGNHDVYHKDPVYNYEMHVSLFNEVLPGFKKYYAEKEEKYLWDDKESTYARHMNVNDAYVYIVAHAYKHFTFSGTGIRTLMDIYVYNEYCKDQMDRNYISEQCSILGIGDYEEKARTTASKLFDKPVRDYSFLTQEEEEYVQYYFSSGTYGTSRQRIHNAVHKLEMEGYRHAKGKYLLNRIYPGFSWFKEHYPILAKYPVLIPFYAFIRPCIKVFTRWNKWMNEIKEVIKTE